MKMKALKLDKNLNVVPEIDEKEDLSKRYSTAQIEENDMVQEKSILKRIDRVLMPLLFFTYLLQFMDKISLSTASILGVIQDTNLVNQEFSWLSSVFYVGYLAASFPASVLLVRLPLGKTIAVTVVIWGAVLSCHAATRNFIGLCTVRVLLGIFESAISPGFSLITSIWYKPSEHASRHSIWFAGNSAGYMTGSLIAYGCAHMSTHPLEPWRWLFIILGVVTVLWGILTLFVLPDKPSKAWFLDTSQQAVADQRSPYYPSSYKNNEWKVSEFQEACKDPKTWFLLLIAILGSLTNGVISNFTTLIIKSLGFDTLTTLLLGLPSAGFQLIVIIGSSMIAHRFRRCRLILVILGNITALVGVLLIRQLHTSNKGGRFAGTLLLVASTNSFPLLLSLVSSNTGGFTKKATVNAFFFVGYCVGNIAGPQLFVQKEAPTYSTAFTSLLVIFCLSTGLQISFRYYLDFANKRRDKSQGRYIEPEPKFKEVDQDQASYGSEMTDLANPDFRYYM